MKTVTLILALSLFFSASIAQDFKNQMPSFLFLQGFQKASLQQKRKTEALFNQTKPIFLRMNTKQTKETKPLFTQKKYPFIEIIETKSEQDIDLEKLQKRTKLLFFKMKMWQYFH